MPTNWDQRFLDLATLVSGWSKDPSTKCGAVIVGPDQGVISVGFNGFPKGMPDTPSLYADRASKYSRIIHCEVNALLYAKGCLPQGCTLYTVPFMPCDRCVVQMLQAGIKRFVAPVPSSDKLERWGEAFSKTRTYISECGAELVELHYAQDTYEPCGCATSDDTHCMTCIQPLANHRCPV